MAEHCWARHCLFGVGRQRRGRGAEVSAGGGDMTSKLEPVTRGGAGDVEPSTTIAGPACALARVTRFSFAIRYATTEKARAKRAAAVADHLDGVPGAVVTDEWADGKLLRLTVHVWPPLRADTATRVAEGCPEYVPDTVHVSVPAR